MTEYSYQGNRREGVVFLFLDDQGRVLVEHRPTKGGPAEVFFPNGSVEMKDHQNTSNHLLTALLREVHEEFAGQIRPLDLWLLQTDDVPEIGVLFYTYVITRWEGQFPAFTTEDGKPFARLVWIPLTEHATYMKYDSAHSICRGLLKHLHREVQ